MKQSGIRFRLVLSHGMRFVCGVCLLCTLPSCNQGHDTPIPKAASKVGSYLPDKTDPDEPQVRSAVFSYTTHKGKVDDDEDKPLSMTTVQVTT